MSTYPTAFVAADQLPAADLTASFLNVAPIGAISMFGGSSAPTSYLLCDGAAISRTTYASLFAIISTTYGVGDGSTTFNLPNLKGKVPVGYNSAETEFDALGETGGEKTHTLLTAEMPAHTHVWANSSITSGGTRGTKDNNGSLSEIATESTGGGGAHNNLQPYIALNFIIRAL